MNSPIFIVGTPRSGTTLVARILGRHSRIFMAGETHFFDDIYSKRDEFGDISCNSTLNKIVNRLANIYERYYEPSDQKRIDEIFKDPSVFEELMNRCRNYRDVFTWFMEIQMRYTDKSRWGNHVPRDIFNIEKILHFYPDSKIIFCVRDIRDFLLSYKYKWRRIPEIYWGRMKRVYHPLVTSLLWKISVRQLVHFSRLVPEKNRIIVKYEQLVTEPEKLVKTLCNLLEEQFEASMLDVDSDNSSFNRENVEERGIFSTSLGRWRSSLSPEESVLAQLMASRELQILGYARERIHFDILKLLFIVLEAPFALIRALYVNKDFRGPTWKYLVKRLKAFFK